MLSNPSLKQRITLNMELRDTLNKWATDYHYMHRPVHPRSSPFGYSVALDGNVFMPDGLPCGFIMFASIHFVKQRELFGYPGLPTKWQVLSLARMWLHDDMPRNSATAVIGKCLKPKGHKRISRAGMDWLVVHPPRFLDEPYHIRLIVTYADKTYGHEGTIYKASNFRFVKETISQRRHKNTRGSGMNGNTLLQFVKELPKPNCEFEPLLSGVV